MGLQAPGLGDKMPKCSFCRVTYEFPRGMTVVRATDGFVRHFCSAKCRKNFLMERDSKKLAWIRKIRISKEEELAQLKKAEMEAEMEAKAKKEAAMEGVKKIG